MVTNAVHARLAWSYGLDKDLKFRSECSRTGFKLNESAYEAYIATLMIASEKNSELRHRISEYMELLFSKEVFPGLVALRSLPSAGSSFPQQPLASSDGSVLSHIGTSSIQPGPVSAGLGPLSLPGVVRL